MHLTTYTDYSLRVLMYLKLSDADLCRVADVSAYFQVSQNHIVKVVNNLAKLGLVETLRGKGGGIRLAASANDKKIGELVRELEPEKDLVQCVNKEGRLCTIAPMCALTGVLSDALDGFYRELDKYTVRDIVKVQDAIRVRGPGKTADDEA